MHMQWLVKIIFATASACWRLLAEILQDVCTGEIVRLQVNMVHEDDHRIHYEVLMRIKS